VSSGSNIESRCRVIGSSSLDCDYTVRVCASRNPIRPLPNCFQRREYIVIDKTMRVPGTNQPGWCIWNLITHCSRNSRWGMGFSCKIAGAVAPWLASPCTRTQAQFRVSGFGDLSNGRTWSNTFASTTAFAPSTHRAI
jgi:hypothetical protein